MSSNSLKKTQNAIISGNIPQVVSGIMSYAVDLGASDIHMEPGIVSVRIRFRIDGVLRNIVEYPFNLHAAIVSRVKIQANLKIDEQRKPQDGRFKMFTDSQQEIELRVSTLPTIHSEKVCMRIQNKSGIIPSFKELGVIGSNLDKMNEMITNANGIALVTGPTGSGKTTTLYSALHQLNNVSVNIMTIEDPVEYEMAGLSQSQVHPDIGYDFSSGLRTALRQDPDIIMVGEIRDQETIEIAIKAALTGHFVLSTIHTNSAVSTIARLLDMGVKPFKITSAIRTIEAQRLVRKLCPHCKEEYEPDENIKSEIRAALSGCKDPCFDHGVLENITLWEGKGCEQCDNVGAKGRLGLHEVMSLDRDIEEMILDHKHESEIEALCIEKGMTTLLQDGFIKALRGDTTLQEVYKVVSSML